MFNLVKQFFNLLNSNQRKRFYILQFLLIGMSFAEIIGVASIVPFMMLIQDLNQLHQDTIFAKIYLYSGVNSDTSFIIYLGLFVIMLLFFSLLMSILVSWKLAIFANNIGVELADRLYSSYIKQNWLFHTSRSTAELTKKITIETQRITNGVLQPFLQLNSRVVLAVFIIITILLYDPKVALVGSSIFGTTYIITFIVVRSYLKLHGRILSQVLVKRFRLINEGFGAIKEILLLGREKNYLKEFKQTGKTFAFSNGATLALTQLPRYLIELIAFGSLVLLVIYIVFTQGISSNNLLATLTIYALAGVKLLPAFQQIYANSAQIRTHIAAFESIKNDLKSSKENKIETKTIKKNNLLLKKKILLKNISFKYPGKSELFLDHFNMSIKVNSVVGIVGLSGSGKSTIIDILLGLIEPEKGELMIDDIIINKENLRQWQNLIGYVPQNIFISEGTIAENVALGISSDEINLEQVKKAIKLANLTEFVESLKQNIFTKVGERGIQLSGGQRQRLVIARALYNNSEVLIFDEATSSLDGVNEKIIMESIYNFSGKKTVIIIAHRIKTIQNCGKIFFIDKGQLISHGNYDELIKTNERFKILATNA